MASPLALGLAEMYHRKCWEPNHLNGFISHHGCLLFHTYLSGSLLWSPPSIWLLPILCAHIYARQENHWLEVRMNQHDEVVYVKGEKIWTTLFTKVQVLVMYLLCLPMVNASVLLHPKVPSTYW